MLQRDLAFYSRFAQLARTSTKHWGRLA